ncbi:MAG: hypothetical protein JST85_03435 [Acidobacteria bacterium]|nr:hypothetical protein [Acidobacteriota bacterium]
MVQGRRWIEQDRYGNHIYLTEEHWHHISEPMNHPEMSGCEEQLRETIRTGQRKQELFNPQKYRYSKAFENLSETNTHIVAVVLFRFVEDETGAVVPNNYIVTAYQKEVG